MEKNEILPNGSELTEVWCSAVPYSETADTAMIIAKMIEATDEYVIYHVYDITGFAFEHNIHIKVFLDENVKPGNGRRLAYSSLLTVDKFGNLRHKCFVFEPLSKKYIKYFHMYTSAEQKESQDLDTVDEEEVAEEPEEKRPTIGEILYPNSKEYKDEANDVCETCETTAETTKDDTDKPKGFAAVAGMDDLKAEMLNEVKFILDNPERAKKWGLHIPNGMLLYGYPGCGKTFFAEKLAEELGMKFLMKHGSDIGSCYMHDTEKNISNLFAEARKNAPCIICLDEIDGIVHQRCKAEEADNVSLNSEVNEFLSQMNNCGKDNVMVIGTTNNPSLIDPAILRTGRMDKLIYVPLPDEKAREEMLRQLVNRVPHDKNINYANVSDACEGMVMSDIEAMYHQVILKCAREDMDITEDMLMVAAKDARRSVYPANDDNDKAMTIKPADTRIKGFTMAI